MRRALGTFYLLVTVLGPIWGQTADDGEKEIGENSQSLESAEAKHSVERRDEADGPSENVALSNDSSSEVVSDSGWKRSEGHRSSSRAISDSNLVSIMRDGHLPSDRQVGQMVTILGSSVAEGEIRDEFVTVLGNSRMTSRVGGEMVTVFGNAYIDGPVENEVVVVMGNLSLGPNADVHDVTVVGGRIELHPDAILAGAYNEVPIYLPFLFDSWDSIHPYVYKGLAWGRFIVPSIEWSWLLALCGLLALTVLAAAFPKPARACADAMEQRPAQSLVWGFAFQLIGLNLISIIILLLVATGIGILALPFVGMGMLFMGMLSFVAVYGVIGRRFGAANNIAMATFLGGAAVSLFYAVPLLGIMTFLAISVIGSGSVVVAVLEALSNRKKTIDKGEEELPQKRISRTVETSASFSTGSEAASGPHIETSTENSESDDATESKGFLESANEENVPVGFGPRFLALIIDFFILLFGLGMLEHLPLFERLDLTDNFLLFWFAYHMVFWLWRSTTIGGLALGLKLERLQGDGITFGVAFVRALASIISFVCLGFGFFWASWDDEKQSWHDKIAGTRIVRVPKGVSLI